MVGMAFFGGFGEVLAALACFFASHSVPALPGVRARIVGAMGQGWYVALHSIVGTASLVWLIVATLHAPYVELWGFHPWTRWVPLLVMPFAMILLVAGLLTPNPFSLGPGGRRYDPSRPGIVAITRHPVLWAAFLWATAHLFPNGELRAVLLFGALTGFSLMGTRLLDHRRQQRMGPEWRQLAANTSNLPFAALLAGRARLTGIPGLAWRAALGLILYAAILFAHGALFGVSPLAN